MDYGYIWTVVAIYIAFVFVGGFIFGGFIWDLFNLARDSVGNIREKYVVVVRQARPGEFGGSVSMKSIKRTDEWRVTWAESAADAVNDVLGAGDVPVMWMRWDMLSKWRRVVLTVREWLSIIRGA